MKNAARVCALAFGALLLGASPSAFAQPRPDQKANADQRARELFVKGDTAYAEGRYEEALGAFEEALELSGRPQLLFNISNALERLGRLTEAVDALEKYIASGKAHDKDVIQKRLVNLKKRVEEQKKEEAKLREEEAKKQRELEEKQRAEAAARAKNEPSNPESPKSSSPPPEEPSRALPIALIATGGAAVATGVVFGILALGARSDAENACSGALCNSDARDPLDREKTFGLVADLSVLGGLALAGVGTYLFVKSSGTPKARGSLPVRMVTTKGGGGVELVGTF